MRNQYQTPEEGARTNLQVIKEPRKRGSQHGLPVAFDDQQVWHISLDGVLAILCTLHHSNSEEEEHDRQHETQAEAYTPDPFTNPRRPCQ